MKLKMVVAAGFAAALVMAPAERVMADGDALVGGIIGGIIGGAIANEANRKHSTARRSSSSTKKSSVSSATREANREVQVALNYFNYPVGTPDGALGPKSRTAISQYQSLLGYAPTGQLTEYERTVLITAYQRAIAGGAVVQQTIATHPMGMRGLLIVQRDEMAGVAPQQPGVMAAVPAAPVLAAPAVPVLAAPALPALVAPEAPALPSFMAQSGTTVSLASMCNKISLVTNSNGGYATSATMTDAGFALGEQFCLARTYAMASSEELAANVPGFTPQQIAEQCKAFGPVLKDHVAALSVQPRDTVLQGVAAFVPVSGMSPAQLAGTAKICLGVGYTTDAMDVAIGSALLLTALGERGYAELLGHHLSQGVGAALRPDLAVDWYDMGVDAMQAGTGPFAPGMTDRPALIRKAAYVIGGRADLNAPALPVLAPGDSSTIIGNPEPGAPTRGVVADAAPGALPFNGSQAMSMAARLPLLLLGQ